MYSIGLNFTQSTDAFNHDPVLIALSCLIAVCGAYTALMMVDRWRNNAGCRAYCWQCGSSTVLGGSIWSIDFVAILTFKTGLPVTDQPRLTILSLLIACGGALWGLRIIDRQSSLLRILIGGGVFGVAIAAMHEVCMASLRFPGSLAYRPGLWGLSLLFGIAVGTLALWLSTRALDARRRMVAAILIGSAICSMLYTRLAGIVIVIDPLALATRRLPPANVAAAVAITTLGLIVCFLALVIEEQRVSAAVVREAATQAHVNVQLRRANADLDSERQRLDAILNNITQGVCLFDGAENLLMCNPRYAEIYGLDLAQLTPGTSLLDILEQRRRAGSIPAMTPEDYVMWRRDLDLGGTPHDSLAELQNGRTVLIRHQPLAAGGWVASHEDITTRRTAQQRLHYLARHDALTGLANRLMLTEQLEAVLSRSPPTAWFTALSIGLEGLTMICDTLGPAMADALLVAVLERLRKHLQPVDLLGRQSDNIFTVILCGSASADTSDLVGQLLDCLSTPVVLDGQEVAVGARIGIAAAKAGGLTADALIKSAGIALQQAGAAGENLRLFEPEMNEVMKAERLLRTELRQAVKRGEFELCYQAQVDLQSRRVRGFEALIRWNHPTRGRISPGSFIPVVEKIGIIDQVGTWALEQACQEASGWPNDIRIGVNVSALQLKDRSFPDIVAGALQRSGLSASRLELEITESCMMESTVVASLHRLRDAGVHIAMDDFGTGYSSLGQLPSLPFDKIKIDQSFVARLGQGAAHTAIIRAIIDLCTSLGAACIAEGVETQEQLAILAREGCPQVQGYLFGEPQSAASIAHLSSSGHFGGTTPVRRDLFADIVLPVVTSPDQASEISFAHVVETANDIVIVTKADVAFPGPTIVYVNPAFTRLTGYEPHEVIGRSPRLLQGPGTSRATLDRIAANLRAGEAVRQKVLNYAKSGAPYWLDLRIVPLRDKTGALSQFVAIERDVTCDKRRLDELEYVADRDTLTGIPNRRALLRTVTAEIVAATADPVRSQPPNARLCLAYIDVDHFKRVNDNLGHATGDAVLFGVADRLAENVRRVDTVGRIGGEEFGVCMPAITLREAAETGQRLRRAVAAQPFDTPAGPVSVTVSIGVAAIKRGDDSLEELMMRADRAMYAAKKAGRNHVVTEPELNVQSPVH